MGLKIQLQKTCVYEFSQEFEVNSNAYSDKQLSYLPIKVLCASIKV